MVCWAGEGRDARLNYSERDSGVSTLSPGAGGPAEMHCGIIKGLVQGASTRRCKPSSTDESPPGNLVTGQTEGHKSRKYKITVIF